MRKTILIIVPALVVIIGIGGYLAFHSLTSVNAATPTPQAEIAKIEGDVRYRTAGTVEWQTGKVGTALHSNDMIETGKGASAEINFYDNARARLGEKTNITLTSLYIDEKNPNNNNVKITLSLGRLWNRIISLVDAKASYEVETSNTVSTVRGTAFDISVDEQGVEEISMVENNIDVQLKNAPEKKIALAQNKRIKFSPENLKKDAPLPEPEDVPETVKNDAWFSENKEQDKEFDAIIKERVQKNEAQLIKLSPENPLYGMQRFAENMRVQFAPPEKKQEIQDQYQIRRAAEAGLLIQEGKPDAALRHINEFLPQEAQDADQNAPFTTPLQNALRQIIIDKKDGIAPELLDRLQKQNIIRENIHNLDATPSDQKSPLPQTPPSPQGENPATSPQPLPTNPNPLAPQNTMPPAPGTFLPKPPLSPLQPTPLPGTILPRPPITNLLPINPVPQPAPLPTKNTLQPVSTPTNTTTSSQQISTTPLPTITVQHLELRAERTNIVAGEMLQLRPVFVLSNGSTVSPPGCTYTTSGDPIGSVDGNGLLHTKSPGGVVTIGTQCTDPLGHSFNSSLTITALLLSPMSTTPLP